MRKAIHSEGIEVTYREAQLILSLLILLWQDDDMRGSSLLRQDDEIRGFSAVLAAVPYSAAEEPKVLTNVPKSVGDNLRALGLVDYDNGSYNLHADVDVILRLMIKQIKATKDPAVSEFVVDSYDFSVWIAAILLEFEKQNPDTEFPIASVIMQLITESA